MSMLLKDHSLFDTKPPNTVVFSSWFVVHGSSLLRANYEY